MTFPLSGEQAKGSQRRFSNRKPAFFFFFFFYLYLKKLKLAVVPTIVVTTADGLNVLNILSFKFDLKFII